MNYVVQLNAFCQKSASVLDAKEQAMYLRLFYIANTLGWPEWFSVANSQLMRELQIKTKNTVRSVRHSLMEKGFIQAIDPGHKQAIRYRLIPLAEKDKGLKNNPLEKGKGLKNNPHGVKNSPLKGQKLTPSINVNINIDNDDDKTPPPIEENSELVEVLHSYQQEISNRPMCSPIEIEALKKGLSMFGKEKTLEAIRRAVFQNKKKLSYIQGIFENWEQYGYNEEKRRQKNYAGKNRNTGNRQPHRGAEPGTSPGLQKLIEDMEYADAHTVHPWDVPNDDSGGKGKARG